MTDRRVVLVRAQSLYRAEEEYRQKHRQSSSPFLVPGRGKAAKILKGQSRRCPRPR